MLFFLSTQYFPLSFDPSLLVEIEVAGETQLKDETEKIPGGFVETLADPSVAVKIESCSSAAEPEKIPEANGETVKSCSSAAEPEKIPEGNMETVADSSMVVEIKG